MKPSAVQAAIVSAVATQFPTWTVAAHGGQFTERELPALLAQAPALLVGPLQIPTLVAAGPGRWKATVDWAVYVLGADQIVTVDQSPVLVPAALVAFDQVYDLLTWLPEQKWSLGEARLPEADSLKADNLYTGHVNLLRVSLWAVAWTQTFFLTT